MRQSIHKNTEQRLSMQTLSLTPYIKSPLQYVIYLGAGIGQELPSLLDLNPSKILLVEGDEEHQELLESEIEQHEKVALIKKRLSNTSGEGFFYRYSLSELNSLQEGTGLQQLFPNVRLLEKLLCQTESLAEWLKTLSLSERQNLLWIDLPGQEASMLNHLTDQQMLDYFDHVLLYAHVTPCYEQQQSMDTLIMLLVEQGFELKHQNNEIDPDRPLLLLTRHPLYWQNKQLEKQLAESQQSSKAKQEKLTQLESQLTDAQQSANAKQEKITTLEAHLSESQKSTAKSNNTIKMLRADLDAQLKDKKSISDQAKSLETQLAEVQQSVESKKTAFTQLQKELTETKQSAQVKTEKLQQLEKQLAESQQSTKAKQQKITELESQLAEFQQSTISVQEKLTALEAKYAALEEEKNKVHNYFTNLKKQAEEGEEKIKALTETSALLEQAKKTLIAEKDKLSNDLETTKANLSTTQQALAQAQATIEALQNNSSQLQQLEEKMAALFNKQGQTMQEYTNALGQHVTRTAKSTAQNIESFLGMQKYLVQDGTPLQLNGSRLSSELALKLTERLHNTHYDLIIEFGTGTSTQLLAKALLKQERDKPHSQHLISRDNEETYSADLPKRIISFEHDKKAIAPLSQQLEQQGLAPLVDLIFAPLSDYTHKGEDYLFYECKSKLKQLAQVFEQREARILVLVDGPDTTDESLSRYPLLPLLLKHLATHQLDIIVTQSHKHLPEELKASWQNLLNKRSLAYKSMHLTQEKDAALFQINFE